MPHCKQNASTVVILTSHMKWTWMILFVYNQWRHCKKWIYLSGWIQSSLALSVHSLSYWFLQLNRKITSQQIYLVKTRRAAVVSQTRAQCRREKCFLTVFLQAPKLLHNFPKAALKSECTCTLLKVLLHIGCLWCWRRYTLK